MKKFTMFSIAFALIACLFAGCGGDSDDDDDDMIDLDGAEGAYLGLTSMQSGSWAEHTDLDGNGFKMEYLGTDTYSGKDCHVMEFEVDSEAGTVISQTWIEKSTGEGVLYVMKQGALLMKLEVSQIPDIIEDVSQLEDDSSDDTVAVSTETYTTPTGKSVSATVYKDNGDENWISGDVPFGMVKSVSDGEVDSELYDFGFSGAQRDISKEEAENAESFGFPDFDIPDF